MMKYITPEEADKYIPLKGTFTNDTLTTCELYTLIPSTNPQYPAKEGWEDVVYYTSKLKSNFGFTSINEYDGWIYILSNPILPNMVKIGYTDLDPYTRSQQISGATGVPVPFKVEWAIQVGNAYRFESVIHKALNEYRVNNRREFFAINVEQAKEVINNLLIS